MEDAKTSVIKNERELDQNNLPRGKSDNSTLFNQCLCNVNNEMCHDDNKFHFKTTLVLMVPDNFLENNEPKTNKIDRKLKDLIDLNPVFIDDWSKESTKHLLEVCTCMWETCVNFHEEKFKK